MKAQALLNISSNFFSKYNSELFLQLFNRVPAGDWSAILGRDMSVSGSFLEGGHIIIFALGLLVPPMPVAP